MQHLYLKAALIRIFPGNRGDAYSNKYDIGEPMRFQAYIEPKTV